MDQPKKGRGRPRLESDQKQSEGFMLKLTPSMGDRFRAAAAANGQTLADALRVAVEYYVTTTETRGRQ